MSTPAVAWLPASIDACALFRLFMPHLHTPNSMFFFKEGALTIDPFAHCKIVVVQRLCTRENYEAIKRLKGYGLKVIYDLDDNLWAVPTYNPAHAIFKRMESGFRFCAVECDAITVSTAPLKLAVTKALQKNKHTKHIPRIEVIENAMDYDWMVPVPEQFKKKKDDRVVLGWAGTNTHKGDVEKVFSLLPKLVEKIPNLYLEFVGLPPPDALLNHPRVRERAFVPIAEFPMRWASWQWDISMAPLDDNRFNTSKSCIKMLEAAALSIPCLVSPIAPYATFCRHSPLLTKHVLCHSLREWEEKLTAIILDTGLRTAVGTEMRRVGNQYDIKDTAQQWQTLFEEVA